MKLLRRTIILFLALVLALPLAQIPAGADSEALDYGKRENWAYFELGEDTGVDIFLICPTVDTKSEKNALDLNEKLKSLFINALDMEKGIYEDAGRLFSPYYRQMSMNAYKLPADEFEEARATAYADVDAAFRWYLENDSGGRGLILAGFSQGADMCLELLKDYYGGEGEKPRALREGLVACYAIGWSVTEETTSKYPQIVPAKGETDTGSVISFDCEDGTLSATLVNPAGQKALSINPLSWRTDGAAADKSLNLGAVMGVGEEPIPALCGARIGDRGELIVTDVSAADYPPVVDIFPSGSYHVYDYLFFFSNLKKNVADRVTAWRTGMPFTDLQQDSWYADAVKYVYEKGLMTGTSASEFSPAGRLTRAQLTTILWRMAEEPVVNYIIPYSDVKADGWYTEAVRWAAAEKIVTKEGPTFGPGDALTREETAYLIWKYAQYSGADVSAGAYTYLPGYTDSSEVSEEYVPAMKWAIGAGIIGGTAKGKLSPKGQLTRAQAATMLFRLRRAGEPLSLWTEGAQAAQELISYVEAVTDEKNADFIPEADRIAVFDLDGTLFCETDPNYFDYTLLAYRVLDDPEYRDRASDFEREVAEKIREQNETGKSFSGLEVDHGRAVASAFAGMTVSQFNEYIQEFKKQQMPSYPGMKRGEGFYRPMAQIVGYLQENGFTVYIVSGTDRLIVRGIIDGSILNIPKRQIIGSDETIVASHQGTKDGLDYVFTEDDELVLGGEFIIKNLKMNKVSVIMQEIGQQPVLSFGNSTGDSSMAQFVKCGNRYRSLAFMLCCDDTERENGNASKAEKMYSLCEQYDWIPISMKNDWLTIYGYGIDYLPAAEELLPAA